MTSAELAAAHGAVVPPFLYLADGRVVPVCVIKAPLYEGSRKSVTPLRYTSHVVGGGYPLTIDVQSRAFQGTVGCLVTDGGH